ncbi:MAG: tetratricopeptide repeat protein [bacterium]
MDIQTNFNRNFYTKLNKKQNFPNVNSNNFIAQKQAESLKTTGDGYNKNLQYDKAINFYKKAIKTKPDYIDVYYNLAKVYNDTGDAKDAINTYKELLTVCPKEIKALAYIGECYKNIEEYDNANKYYKAALNIDPKYDLANRFLKEANNLKLSKTNLNLAEQMKAQYARKNLNASVNLVMTKAPKELTKDMQDIKYAFNKTNALSGVSNIAQYENNERKIVITDRYVWAAPEIIAAYIVHEAVHARDHDTHTSIKEEQDAYRESVKFWLANSNGIKDPEMELAADLYLKSPEALDERVGEVYTKRNNSIAEFSPYHGISAGIFGLRSKFRKLKDFFKNTLSSDPAMTSQIIND